ncbi:unnamed protein product [Ambrosiozyma monospora]|uniref:Unnamed protein product n=1 Tax=Ambrosiozyma monospora TaxID=43982 RepID=A0ACB5U569_AMBMO|nr:unnamed protein product [Ambrosiozyma monospora]
MSHKSLYVNRAIEFYLKAIELSNDTNGNDTDVDRFCALWLENSSTTIDRSLMSNIPTYNFIPWVNQLTSRLSDDKSDFQSVLKDLVVNIAIQHPFHIGYHLTSLSAEGLGSEDAAALSRKTAAHSVWNKLLMYQNKCNVVNISDVFSKIAELTNESISIANTKFKSTKPSIMRISHGWWVSELPNYNIPSPVETIKVQRVSRYDLNILPTITAVEKTISLAI